MSSWREQECIQMENTIKSKGYVGQFRYEEGDEAFHGIVLGLRNDVHFQGTCVTELKQSLAGSVDDYLAWCEEEGGTPEKPYTGRFGVRIAPDLHRTISMRAKAAGVSLTESDRGSAGAARWRSARGAGAEGCFSTAKAPLLGQDQGDAHDAEQRTRSPFEEARAESQPRDNRTGIAP